MGEKSERTAQNGIKTLDLKQIQAVGRTLKKKKEEKEKRNKSTTSEGRNVE